MFCIFSRLVGSSHLSQHDSTGLPKRSKRFIEKKKEKRVRINEEGNVKMCSIIEGGNKKITAPYRLVYLHQSS